jgi:hypothetical protein
MKCRYCDSERVYRSQRRGVWEGIFLRLLLVAPYRCRDCGARFNVFHHHHKNLLWNHEASFAEFIGLRGREYRIRQWMVNVLLALILLIVSIVILFRLIK